jgi:hypothetical protein
MLFPFSDYPNAGVAQESGCGSLSRVPAFNRSFHSDVASILLKTPYRNNPFVPLQDTTVTDGLMWSVLL